MKQMLVLLSKCKQTEHDNVNGNDTVKETVNGNESVTVTVTMGDGHTHTRKNICSRFIH